MKAAPLQTSLEDEVTKRRGRPSILSAETILQASLDLAAADPLTPVSVKMIARKLRVTSMAIYKYFASRDELLQAMSTRLLDGLRFEWDAKEDPARQIELWLRAVRSHLLAHKELINLLSWDQGITSIAWQNHTAPLFEALRRSGLKADAMAQTALWITLSGISAIVFEVRERLVDRAPNSRNSSGLIAEAQFGQLALRDFSNNLDYHDNLFEFVIAKILFSLSSIGEK